MERQITFTVKMPEDCNEDQFYEWVLFTLNYTPEMKMSNPLVNKDLIAETVNIEGVKLSLYDNKKSLGLAHLESK